MLKYILSVTCDITKYIMKLKSFLEKILDFIYYRRCYICGKKCIDIFLCKDCLDNIYSNLKFTKAEKFGTTIYCGTPYESEVLKVIRGLKYHQKEDFSQILTQIILKVIEHYNIDLTDFVICPVPIHKNRYKKRKYNHMELVAREIAKELNLKVSTNFFERTKDTMPLYNLSFSQREQMIKNAFKISYDVKDKNILLIDDIVTTGSTIKEISSSLKKYSPRNFIVICASRSNNCNL